MLIVAGLSIKNLHPRVWDPESPYYLPQLGAVMVSYAEFHQLPRKRERAMSEGLHAFLGVPDGVRVFLDNGSFYFLKREGLTNHREYVEFIRQAKPDWYPIPQDFIPSPNMCRSEQRECMQRTMENNSAFGQDGFVSVIHISDMMTDYVAAIKSDPCLNASPEIALGGIVPNLLRMPKARPYREVLEHVRMARSEFSEKNVHLFGVGATSTLHLAVLLGMDSADSSGWRNRAARGIVQLPGSGDRVVANLGSWRGRSPGLEEWEQLRECPCPACEQGGLEGLKAGKRAGFEHRATHNLWILLNEGALIEQRLLAGSYGDWYESHLDNSTYLPLIRETIASVGLGMPEVAPARSRLDHTSEDV